MFQGLVEKGQRAAKGRAWLAPGWGARFLRLSGKREAVASRRFADNNFDLLRILAATQVLYFHSLDHLGIAVPAWSEVFQNFPGVPIFFVISGYLVSASYERSGSPVTYFRNRFLRIYPGLWVCLLLTVLVAAAFGFSFFHRGALIWGLAQMAGLIYTPGFLANFGFGSYNGSLWTIPIELQFYCLLPLVYLLIKRPHLGNLPFFSLLAAFVAIALLGGHYAPTLGLPGETGPEKLFRYSFIPHFYLFLAGLLLQRLGAYRSRLIYGKGLYWTAAYLLFCYFVPQSVGSLVASRLILAACTVSLAYTLPSIAEKLLKGNDISYGVYIYHGLLLNVLISLHLLHRTEYLLIEFFGAFLAGYLSWVLVERSFLQSKRKKLRPARERHTEPSPVMELVPGGEENLRQPSARSLQAGQAPQP
jgi:peptidoglycan/LPS O-acetylase OafA/YrhL